MKLPVHNNPTVDIATAPYNFVQLPEKVVALDPHTELPDQDSYYSDRHTGHIDCILMTESPLFVRAPLTAEEFDRQEQGEDENLPWRNQVRNKPDFFYTDPARTPRIPGSSLRGMLRQLVEIIGYGKMEFVSNQKLVYRAVGDTTSNGDEYRKRVVRYDGESSNRSGKRTKQYTPLIRAGYMRKQHGDFFIQPASEIGGTTFARIRIDDIPRGLVPVSGCRNASHIYFQSGPYDYQDVRGGFLRIKYAKVIRASATEGSGLLKGVLARSGEMTSKRSEAVVFPADKEAKAIPIDGDLVRAYRDQISQEQETLLGKEGVLKDGQPVFYLMEKGQLVFFGHTMMMRLPYLQSPRDFIPDALRSETDLDLAEAIFGFTKKTGEGKARSYASRLSVGDALLEPGQSDIWLMANGVLTPKILGSPKLTTFQHYLTQQSPDPQERGQYRDGSPKYVKELSDYTASTPARSVLRGHKLYWHKGRVATEDIEEVAQKLRDERGRENEQDRQHTQMRPVAAGVNFRCRIRFENLSDVELGALLWALTLPGQPNKEYRHSIGMAKPYGMGAVKLEPTLYLDDRKKRYGALFQDEAWQTGTVAASARISELIAAFDRFIRQEIGATAHTSLAELERIQMLLRMMEWPGPDKELTRYLEIERQDPIQRRGKVNEYKGRPVLPDPLHIDSIPTAQSVSPARPPAGQRGSIPRRSSPDTPLPARRMPTTPTGSRPPSAPKQQDQRELSRPASIEEIAEGMHLEGKVVRVGSGRVVVDILGEEASLSMQNVVPPARDQYDLEERFPEAVVVQIFVRGRNKKGRLQLTMSAD